jgi:hypothetical protein
VAEHVRVDREGHAGALAKAGNERMETLGRHWPAALRTENMGARRLLTLEAAKIPQLIAADRMNAWHSSFSAPHMQAAGRKLDLMPLQVAYF